MSDDDKPPSGLPSVLISMRWSGGDLDEPALIELARTALIGEGNREAELSISFVEEAEIEDLHVRYMDERGRRLLGDVVIAPAVAARNNPDDPQGEMWLLLVHGILHLLGYDHEDDAEKALMWARQERYSGVRAP